MSVKADFSIICVKIPVVGEHRCYVLNGPPASAFAPLTWFALQVPVDPPISPLLFKSHLNNEIQCKIT